MWWCVTAFKHPWVEIPRLKVIQVSRRRDEGGRLGDGGVKWAWWCRWLLYVGGAMFVVRVCWRGLVMAAGVLDWPRVCDWCMLHGPCDDSWCLVLAGVCIEEALWWLLVDLEEPSVGVGVKGAVWWLLVCWIYFFPWRSLVMEADVLLVGVCVEGDLWWELMWWSGLVLVASVNRKSHMLEVGMFKG